MSPGGDVAMASTAPADAELLDDADTEAAAVTADRCLVGASRISSSSISSSQVGIDRLTPQLLW